MNHEQYNLTVSTTIANYGFFTIADFLTSVVLSLRGFVELNPLGQMFPFHYWAIFWAVSIGFPVLLLEFGNRWAFLLMWIPTITHIICVVNNIQVGIT